MITIYPGESLDVRFLLGNYAILSPGKFRLAVDLEYVTLCTEFFIDG
ncbi:hypothetical protein [Anaerolentibacter hominis]